MEKPETLPKQPEEQETPIINPSWPSLPSPTGTDSPIQPGQREKPASPGPWKTQAKGADDHEKDRVGKYAQYFKDNEILPIPEIIEKLEPRILSLVVSDIKTRRLVGLRKEAFEDLLRKAGVPCLYFCRRSFATWDVLLPTQEQAAKAASATITTKFFRLQPEYMGTRRIRVTVCNVPATVTGEVLAAFLSRYGRVEESNLLRSASGTAYGDHVFRLCLTREGFQAIPEIIISRERQMMVVVEGRRPRCWSCKQLGHISKFCPQKDPPSAAVSTALTTTTTATITTATISSATVKETGQVQPKKAEGGWTEVTRKKKRSPKKVEDKASTMTITAAASPAKGTDLERSPQESPPKSPPKTSPYIPKSVTAPIPRHIVEHPVPPAKQSKSKKKPIAETPGTPMETCTNLKRRRNSNEGAAKKICAGPPCIDDPLEGPSNAFQPPPQQPPPQQAPTQMPIPFPPPLPLLPPPFPPPPPPQYRITQHAPSELLQPPQPIQLSQPPQLSEPPPPQPIQEEPRTRPHQIQPRGRTHSLERQSPQHLFKTLSLPSLSPFSSPELFPEMSQAGKEPTVPVPAAPVPAAPVPAPEAPAAQEARLKLSRKQAKAAKREGQEGTEEQIRKAVAFCTVGLDSVTDYQLRKLLKPLLDLEKIQKKRICNPLNFTSAAMVTTFIRTAGDRTKGVWKFLDTVRQTDVGVKLAELEHSSLRRCLPFCSGRVPIFVHPSFYRSLKVRFPLDVGGVSRDGRVTTELGTGSLRQAVGILTPEDFRPIISTD